MKLPTEAINALDIPEDIAETANVYIDAKILQWLFISRGKTVTPLSVKQVQAYIKALLT